MSSGRRYFSLREGCLDALASENAGAGRADNRSHYYIAQVTERTLGKEQKEQEA